MGSFRHAMWFLFSVAFSATAVPEAEAGPTSVLFDLPYTIECRDVTPEGFALQHPGAKVSLPAFPTATMTT